jgi:hypothetical protein
MTISDLMTELSNAKRQHGDVDVLVDSYQGLHKIVEVGIDDAGLLISVCGTVEG